MRARHLCAAALRAAAGVLFRRDKPRDQALVHPARALCVPQRVLQIGRRKVQQQAAAQRLQSGAPALSFSDCASPDPLRHSFLSLPLLPQCSGHVCLLLRLQLMQSGWGRTMYGMA
jgi:hypothetical protein